MCSVLELGVKFKFSLANFPSSSCHVEITNNSINNLLKYGMELLSDMQKAASNVFRECPGVEFLCGFSFLDLFLALGIAVMSLLHADVFTRGHNQQPSGQSVIEGKGLPDFGNLCRTVLLWTCMVG